MARVEYLFLLPEFHLEKKYLEENYANNSTKARRGGIRVQSCKVFILYQNSIISFECSFL